MARKFSVFGEHWQHPVGALIIKGNRVLSWGYNRNKTHSRSPHFYKHIHAEFDAIRKCDPEDLIGATIYVSRSKKDGTPALSKPCPSCRSMLKSMGVETVFYTTEGSYTEERV